MTDEGSPGNTTLDVDHYRRRRSNVKGRLTKLRNDIDANGATYDRATLDAKLARLDTLAEQFEKFQEKIEEMDEDEMDLTDHDEFEVACDDLRAIITRLRDKLGTPSSSGAPPGASTASTSAAAVPVINVKLSELPKVDLPTFDGKFSSWQSFWTSYKALVEEDSCSDIVKFQHLRNCLKGAPLKLVEPFELSADGYALAKAELVKRYENKRFVFQSHIAEIFDTVAMSKTSPTELRNLLDSVNGHLAVLEKLGNSKQIVDCLLIHLIGAKLTKELQARWERSAAKTLVPSWADFRKCLNEECQALEQIELTRRHQQTATSPSTKPRLERSTTSRSYFIAADSEERRQAKCAVCSISGHKIYKCPQFTNMTPTARQEKAKALRLCLNCLTPGHVREQCRAGTCRQCNAKHHTMLHFGASSTAMGTPTASDSSPSQTAATNYAVTDPVPSTSSDSSSSALTASTQVIANSSGACNVSERSTVLLATAIVDIRSHSGLYVPARALLDSGSQMTFVSEHLAQILGLPRLKADTNVTGISGESHKVKSRLEMTVKSRVREFERSIEALIIPRITNFQPIARLETSALLIPPDLRLADPAFDIPQRIDLLLGADIFFEVLASGRLRLGNNLPLLQETLLGWIVVGPAPLSRDATLALVAVEDQDERVEQMVERFWSREDEFPTVVKHLSHEERAREEHFRSHVRREVDGRFSVLLPFRQPPTELGDSFTVAERRFLSLERRFSRDPEYRKAYSAAIHGFLDAGFAEYVDQSRLSPPLNFLPHHGVTKESSTSTKLRPVFDASCSTSSGRSLNDLLMVGPVLQDDLFTVLLRGRNFRYMLMADIQKMYLQIVVRAPDNNLQCILWRDSSDSSIRIIRLNRVTFGTAPASYISVRCLHELAALHKGEFPLGAEVLVRDFYVDNMISGADTADGLRKIRQEVTELLARGQFPLRKWATNCPSVLGEIAVDERERFLPFEETEYTKAVGLIWLPHEDQFAFD